MGSKSEERECFDQVIKLSKLPILKGNVIETERPDFIIGTTGLEHFMIEVCQNYEMPRGEISKTPVGSLTRKQTLQHSRYVARFQGHPEELTDFVDSGNALIYLENCVNKTINTISDFKYEDFIDNFKRIFNKHSNNINEYYKTCRTLGFLIELPYLRPIGPHCYTISNAGSWRNQNVRSIPVTRDMIKILKSTKINFLILYMRDVLSTSKDARHCQVVYLDMSQNVEQQLIRQHITICDKFGFSQTFSNRDVVKLNMS